LKSCLASLAVLLLSLGFSSFLYWNPFIFSGTFFLDHPYFYSPALFLGANFITYCFIVIVAVGFESALYLIFRNRQVWKIRMFLPSIMILVVAPLAVICLVFSACWLYSIFNLIALAMVTIRICILTIAMTAALLIVKREKK